MEENKRIREKRGNKRRVKGRGKGEESKRGRI
jgi:hypothetical protein